VAAGEVRHEGREDQDRRQQSTGHLTEASPPDRTFLYGVAATTAHWQRDPVG
jgi:hypothetical protein